MSKVVMIILAVVTLAIVFGIGVYNKIVSGDENVTTEWSKVVNQYQRRADLIPNLIKTVEGAAANEKDILSSVIDARSKATSIQATPELINDPASFQKFTQAQGQLGSALSKLLVTVERYPDIKSTQGFLELLTQLEGTENRIAVARTRYVTAVKDYNLAIRKFPGNLFASSMGFTTKQNFSVENEAEIAQPPSVNFNKTAPAK